jgi:plastocyanin
VSAERRAKGTDVNLASRKTAGLIGIVSGVALLLTGCGKSGEEQVENSTGTQETPAASAPAATTAAAQGTVVNVTEKEFSIALSQATFTPGVYTFVVKDEGAVSHNLNIKGPGVTDAATSKISAGGSTSLTVTLKAGSYELWCSIGSHKANGMDMTITVA